jgi:hypothetical protein
MDVEKSKGIRITKAMYDTATKYAAEESGVNIQFTNKTALITFYHLPKDRVEMIKGLWHNKGANPEEPKCKVINEWRSYSLLELNEKFAEIEWETWQRK